MSNKTHLPMSNVDDVYEQLKDYINNAGVKGVFKLTEVYNNRRTAGTMKIFLDKSSSLIFTPSI